MKCKVKFLMDTSAERFPTNYSGAVLQDGADGSQRSSWGSGLKPSDIGHLQLFFINLRLV
jgi:hypothetical protein